jgi:hypothetical protein
VNPSRALHAIRHCVPPYTRLGFKQPSTIGRPPNDAKQLLLGGQALGYQLGQRGLELVLLCVNIVGHENIPDRFLYRHLASVRRQHADMLGRLTLSSRSLPNRVPVFELMPGGFLRELDPGGHPQLA